MTVLMVLSCLTPGTGCWGVGTLDYSRMEGPFHNIGGVIVVFW